MVFESMGVLPWNTQQPNKHKNEVAEGNFYLYFFKPTRSGQVMKEKLKGYEGAVLTDAYSGYNALDDEEMDIDQGNCWSHGRRNFINLESYDESVRPILDLIDELFEIEKEAKTFEELEKLRSTKSKLVTEKLRQQLYDELPNSREVSAKRKAIDYLLKRWPRFTRFLTDIRLPLTNNEAERTVRHAVMGRKNFYGAATHSGAETAATLYTVIESCKKNDLDPESFIKMALELVARGDAPPTPLSYARQIRQ